MGKKTFRYNSIFLYASLQFCGNIEEYFAEHTKKLIVFIVQPRIQNKDNLLRVYKGGILVEERKIELSENIFLYYFLWYIRYLQFLFTYFSKKDRVTVITSHPVSFFGMSLQRLLLGVRFFFWIEYFPRVTFVLRLFDDLKRFYHNRVEFVGYFGDRLNKMMNGKVISTQRRKTVLWGIKPKIVRTGVPHGAPMLLFIGIVKESQGLDIVFEFLKTHRAYRLSILGMCDQNLYRRYKRLFKTHGIEKQIYFPNRFIPEEELQAMSKKCFVGVAPYTTGKDNGTYYIDPGKVKAYTEFGLPVVMSNTSSIVSYIKRFKAGEVINRDATDLARALERIRNNYPLYLEGVKKFNTYFYFDTYYQKKFAFLERA